MTGKLPCNIKFLVLSLLVLTALDSSLFAQVHSLTGQINNYGRVTTIGTDNVVISDPIQFSYFNAGDTVLLIQMKGAECLVPEDGTYGDYQISVGTTGEYEFLTVQSVGAGNKVTFRNNIIKTYSVQGDVQLVRVPSYNAVKVDGELNCQAWDSITKTGGVLALFVGTKLTLNANINVKGEGFRGGTAFIGLGNCISSGGGLNNFSYPDSWQNSGLKGESQVFKAYVSGSEQYPIFPGYAKGYGPNFTGGGGGNGRFSGGGGGAQAGTGGKGGRESVLCSTQEDGGIGGKSINPVLSASGLFLGGGGGGSTYLAGATPSSGGRGGGIVIIVCETFDGNGNSILAEGEKPATASGNAGSGGGGAGGTIALYLSSFSSNNITLSVKGGDGGNNAGNFGEGGGGGGGRLNVSNIAIPGNVTRIVDKGSFGTRAFGHTALAGTPGENLTTFVPLLNGFLFNTIYSSVTKNQIDSICSDTFMGEISGTNPIGGTLPYTYLWESSVTSGTGGFSPAPGTNNLSTYTPPAKLTQTTWFRRTITDASTTPIIDVSTAVMIKVQQAITGNLVGNDETICSSWNPDAIIPLNSGPSNGNGNYAYQWLSNTDNTTWTTNASGTSTLSNYDPAALLLTTYYKRKVTSGRCIDNSTTVTITVLPSITGNITTRPDSVICQGSLFNTLGASAAGGYGSFLYQWQSSPDNATWLPAPGTNSNTTYSVDTLEFATIEDRYYRRVVSSDPVNICTSKSVPIHLTRYHKIIDNAISADQTICSGITPAPLSGSQPHQGNLSYSYQWQDSSKLVPWTIMWTSQTGYQPAPPSDSTWYRRIVNSSKCTSTSNKIKIIVHNTPVAYAGPDHKVCGRVVTLAAVKSYGTGLWIFPSRAHSADPTLPKAVITLDSFNTAMDTVTFFWRETNWTCTSMDAVKITFDNHPDKVDAGTGGDIMTFDNSTLVHASPVLNFETGTWTVVSGNGDPVDEHSDSTYMRNIAIGENIYKWTVTNDTCSLSDTVRFIVSHPIIPEGISPNGDMINDTLNISGIDFNVQEADLKILNSAGTLVFSTSHRKNQNDWVYWDGKDSKGAILPEGTYYYLLNVYTPETGHVSKVSGFIILKRH
jgi:hypothetical protein